MTFHDIPSNLIDIPTDLTLR